METATRAELQSPSLDASLISGSEAELLNAMSSDESKEDAKPMSCSHLRSGCNSENRASMSGRVFVLVKIKTYQISSLSNFETLKKQYPFLRVFSEDLIERRLSYQKPVMIKDEETEATLLSQVFIQRPREIKNILAEIEKVKSDPSKYAKEALQNGDNCALESIRKRILPIYNALGRNWYKEYTYVVDKYPPFRDHFYKHVFGRWITNYDYLITDHKGPQYTRLGKKLADVLYHIAIGKEFCLGSHDFGNIITQILECFSNRYGPVSIDLKPFIQRGLMIEHLLHETCEGVYEVRNADCISIGSHMKNSSIVLINCKMDQLLYQSKNINAKIFGGRAFFEPFVGAKNINKQEITGFKIYKLGERKKSKPLSKEKRR